MGRLVGFNARTLSFNTFCLVLGLLPFLTLMISVVAVEPAFFAVVVAPPSLLELVPSQVSSFHRKSSGSRRNPRSFTGAPWSDHTTNHLSLVPSQVIKGTSSFSGTSLCASTTTAVDTNPSSPSNSSDSATNVMKKKAKSRRKPRRTRSNKTDATVANNSILNPSGDRLARLASNLSLGSDSDGESTTNDENESNVGLSSSVAPNAKPPLREGNLPDVFWRSIPMEHLRLHPRFVPLPESHEVRNIENLEEVRQFRQDSWQWDALHVGRCTTSQAVAALGFLENMAGEVLNVPASWRRGGRGAYQRLGHPSPLRTIDDMNRVLLEQPSTSQPTGSTSSSTSTTEPTSVWTPCADPPSNDSGSSSASISSEISFAARYDFRVSTKEMDKRRKLARQFSTHDSASSLRLTWGSVQEATALLTALNYFAEKDPAFVMREVGMCGAGLALNVSSSSSLLVGASPDAVLCHGDGSIEALEVKNHCPFVTPFLKKGKSRPSKRFRVGDRHLAEAGIFAQYIPQLMLEMLCLGDACRSAVMVRQSATKGALLLRVRRNDEWIDEMLHFLRRFQNEFVGAGRAPPPNFFFLGEDPLEVKRYRRFLNKTMEVRNRGVEVIAHLPPESIQRAQGATTPLFLD